MQKNNNIKIAWLLPNSGAGNGFAKAGGGGYLEPFLIEFQKFYPDMFFITTGEVHPYYKKMFNIYSKGNSHWKKLYKYDYGYKGIALLSPFIVFPLLMAKPRIVISVGFNFWTIIVSFFKLIGRWKIIVLFEGPSPTDKHKDDIIRLSIRRFLTRYVDAFITNSNKAKCYLQDYLGSHKSKVFRIVYKLADVNITKKNKNTNITTKDKKHPIFLYAGQLIPRKGCSYLLKAWAEVQNVKPDCPSLLIAGDGYLKNDLISEAKNLNLKNVHFLGNIQYDAIGFLYQFSDVFIFPSLEDTWGVVISEALQYGMPVLCSKYVCASELIQNGQNGYIFDPKDLNTLSELILKLIDSPVLLKAFGQKSREIMLPYTPTNAAVTFRTIIEQLLKNKTH
jgi:glycosyltransferase involved in cell wall biosynthesis